MMLYCCTTTTAAAREAMGSPAYTPAIRVEDILSKHPKRSRWLTQTEVENDSTMNLQPGSIGFFYSRLRIGNQSNKKQMETTRRLEAKGIYRERGLKNPRRVWWLAFVGEGGARPRFDIHEQEHRFVDEEPAARAARKTAAGIPADLDEIGSSAAGSTKHRVPPRPVSTRPKRHAKKQRFYDDSYDERPQHLSSKNIKKTDDVAPVIDPATEAAAAAARDSDSGNDEAEPVSNEDSGSGNGGGSGRGNTRAGRRGAARPEARHAEENDQADEGKEEEAVQPEMEERASRGRGGKRSGGRSGYGWARSKKPRRRKSVTASRRAKCADETIDDEDKDDVDKATEDKEIGDEEIEDKVIEDKEIEKKEIEDKEIEEKEIEDKEIEDKEIEDKEIEDKEIEEIEEIDRGEVGGSCQEDGPNSDNWAQCDTCKKWRRLPDSVDPETLPAKWFCSMNKYDPIRARCRAPQEDTASAHHDEDEEQDQSRRRGSRKADRRQGVDDDDNKGKERVDEDEEEDRGGEYDDEGEDYDVRGEEGFVPTEEEEEEVLEHDEEEEARDENLRRFTSAWARRIKGAEKAELRLTTSMSTRGKRKAESIGDTHWIRCQSCGKWRSLLRSMDPSVYVGPGLQFYCLMNTWHESLASCSAPQENHYTVANLFPPRQLPSPSATATNYEEHDDVENEAFVWRRAGMNRGNEGVADRRESWDYGHHGGFGDVGVWGKPLVEGPGRGLGLNPQLIPITAMTYS